MNAPRVNAAIALVLMVLAYAGSLAWTPTRHLADTRPKVDLEAMFPKAFADWKVDDRMPVQLISPDTQAVLNKIYNQTLSRTYVNRNGDRIMLAVAYGGDQSDGTRAHLPEICYPAQGFRILSSETGELRLTDYAIPVRRLVARLGGRIEPITYWAVVGDRIALSGPEQKLAQLAYSTRGVIPDGMLVRASSIDADAPNAFSLQQRFLSDLAQALPPDQRVLVIGKRGV